jgi:Xaa-Pro dipeptidase
MTQLGADGVAFVIVVAGPNSADPHAGPSDRPVQSGDFLTIDFGAVKDGYPADLTRTFVVGEPTERQREMYDAVLRANKAGRQAVGPGVHAEDIDRAARQEIEAAGYGEFFIHRTGHGLGLEVHEPPYIVEGNSQPVVQGAVFTIEPGVYLPGFGGVRIEDDVQVTADGADCLTSFSRELMSLA